MLYNYRKFYLNVYILWMRARFDNFMHFNFSKYFECSTLKVDEANAIASLNIFQFYESYILCAPWNENCFDDRN